VKYLIATGIAIEAYFALVTAVKEKPESQFFKVDRSLTETGKWIVFNEKDLAIKPGQKASMLSTTLGVLLGRDFGAVNLEQIPGLNAYAFTPEKTPSIGEGSFKINGVDSGWRTQKELVHHTFMGTAPSAPVCYRSNGPIVQIPCEGIPGPTPTPTPEPTPGPTPTPGPIEADKSWGRTRVRAKEALAIAEVKTENVKTCVIDTGIDLQHPQNGEVIGSIGFAGAVQDRAGHGTHVAGTIAGRGGVGVSRSKLLICKGLSDSGSGSSSSLAQCLNWCGQQGAQIVSNSWGSPNSDQMINAAIAGLTQRGIYVFVAAGNDSGPVNWPAKLAGSNPLVYAIAASDQRDQITSFSSRGPEIRYISPGAGIVSNYPGGGTRSMDGTSMATPPRRRNL